MSYPESFNNLPVVNPGDPITASMENDQSAAINSIEYALGTLPPKSPVRLATAAALPSYTATTDTLTANPTYAALQVDGVSVALDDRILVLDEAGGAQKNNGIYSVTAIGDSSNPWVLTRSVDMNDSSQVEGAVVYVREGSARAGTMWGNTNQGAFMLGTTNMTWDQLAGPPQSTVNLNGQDITNGTWQGSDVAVGYGGTGASSAAGARSNLSAAASGANADITSLSGLTTPLSVSQGGTGLSSAANLSVLTTSGSGVPAFTTALPNGVTGTTQSPGDDSTKLATTAYVDTFPGSSHITTVGSISSGTWTAAAIGAQYGGTGQTSCSTGDLLYASGTNVWARLAANTSGVKEFLSMTSSVPSWGTLAAGDIPNIAESQVTNLTTDLAAKAPLASPALTGTPTAPTAASNTNTTQIATTAFGQELMALLATSMCQGRLSLSSSLTAPITDETEQTTLYFTPYCGNSIGLYNPTSSQWEMHSFAQLNISSPTVTAGTSHSGTSTSGMPTLSSISSSGVSAGMFVHGTGLTQGSQVMAVSSSIELNRDATGTGTNTFSFYSPVICDIFVWNNGGTLTLQFGTPWSVATIGSGARVSGAAGALTIQDGVLVNAFADSHGGTSIPAKAGRYVGTVVLCGASSSGGNGFMNDDRKNRYVYNHYNRRPRYCWDTGSTSIGGAAAYIPQTDVNWLDGMGEVTFDIAMSCELTECTSSTLQEAEYSISVNNGGAAFAYSVPYLGVAAGGVEFIGFSSTRAFQSVAGINQAYVQGQNLTNTQTVTVSYAGCSGSPSM